MIRGSAWLRIGLPLCAWGLLASAASAQCLPGISCAFSINGKKGRFLDKEVTPDTLAKADKETGGGLSDGRSLDSVSVNKGSVAGTGIRMPMTEQKLLEMLATIRKAWPDTLRAPPPISVRVLGATSYAPVAHPDNVITVPLGLIINAKTDDEVLWVLAHEFSHIALAHFSREASQRRLKSGVETAVDCARVGLTLAQTRATKTGNTINFVQGNDPRLQSASVQVWAKSNIVGEFLEAYNQHLSRQQEDQADAVGYDLAFRAKYSQDGFTTALAYLKAEEERQGDWLKKFGDDLGDYTKKAASRAGAEALSTGNISAAASKFEKNMLSNAGDLLFKRLDEVVTASHRPAEQRLAGMRKYVGVAYKDIEDPDSRSAWLAEVRALPEYADAKTAVNAVDTARTDIPAAPCADKDEACVAAVNQALQKAETDLQPATRTRFADTPLVLNTKAALENFNKNYAEADRLYSRAELIGGPAAPAAKPTAKGKGKAAAKPIAAPAPVARAYSGDPYLEQSLDGFADHVDLLVRTKNYAKATQVIALARSRFNDDDRFLAPLITIGLQTHNNPMLIDAVKRCAATEDQAVRASCNVAFLGPDQTAAFDKLDPAAQDKVLRAYDEASANVRKGSTCGLNDLQTIADAAKAKGTE